MIQFSNADTGDRRDKGGTQAAEQGFAVAGVLGQAGCLTVAILVMAIAGGLWLDSLLGTRPWVTLVLVLTSFPFGLFMNFLIVRRGTARLGLRSASGRAPQGAGPPSDGR